MRDPIVCGDSWSIKPELVGWAGIGEAWYETGLDEICDEFEDLAYDCPDLDIHWEDFDDNPLGDRTVWIETNHPEAARKFLRDRTAQLLRKHMDQLREKRQQARIQEEEGQAKEEADKVLVTEVIKRVIAHFQSKKTGKAEDRISRLSISPWPDGKKAPWEKGTVSLCTWDLDVGVDDVEETILFRRLPKTDQLWVDSWAKSGKAISAPHLGSERESQLALITMLILSRIGFGWPVRPKGGFLFSTEVLEHLIQAIEDALDRLKKEAESS